MATLHRFFDYDYDNDNEEVSGDVVQLCPHRAGPLALHAEITVTLYHLNQFQLPGIVYLRSEATSFAWSQHSAELHLKIGERQDRKIVQMVKCHRNP